MSLQVLRKSFESPAATPGWRAVLGQIGPQLAAEGRRCDQANEFVGANMALLRAHGFLELGVPAELGGAGLSRAELAVMLRELAHHCPSTALALAMHTHVAAAAAWRWRHQKAPTDGLLKRVAAERLQLLSSGGSDWLLGSGKAVKVDGGYQIYARKVFASGAPAAHLFMTGAIEEDAPEGPTVLQFGVPMNAPGVSIVETWDTLGMRGTGSHDVSLDGVFVPDAAIGARRKPGVWHPLLHIVALVAMPLVYAVYAGIAEAARNLTVEALAKRRDAATIDALGALDTELAATRIALDSMVTFAETAQPGPETTNTIFIHRALVCRGAIRTVDLALDAASGAGYFRRLSRTAVSRRAGRSLSSIAAGAAANTRGPHGARSADRRLERRTASLVSRPSGRLASWVGHAAAREREPAPRATRRWLLDPGSRGVYPRAARSADPGARPGHRSDMFGWLCARDIAAQVARKPGRRYNIPNNETRPR
ncbi:MAG: acyl-CoA dehydrogenase family protein [Xanthobacteraceae bacterium]